MVSYSFLGKRVRMKKNAIIIEENLNPKVGKVLFHFICTERFFSNYYSGSRGERFVYVFPQCAISAVFIHYVK